MVQRGAGSKIDGSAIVGQIEASESLAINNLSASEIARHIARGELTSEAAVSACLARIKERDSVVRAWAYLDPDLALAALSEGDNPFTSRERDVLAATLDGASIADIAAQLSLSEGTVRNHLSTAIQKLNAHNRMEAARRAQQKGWL